MSEQSEDADTPAAPTLVKAAENAWQGAGLRDFFLYKDLGVAAATGGKLLMQLVRANNPPQHGTGWHRYQAEFHVIYMLRGSARFMVDEQEVVVAAGDVLNQPPDVARYLFDYSPDMEYLEVVSPVDFRTVEVKSEVEVPQPRPW